MNRRSLTQFTGLASAATLLSGCGWESPDEWRSKMTVTVSTPHGDVSGSAVRWHQFAMDPILPQGHFKQRGEAAVVDLGEGKFLFALIEERKPHDYSVFYGKNFPESARLDRLPPRKETLGTDMYPMLVTFGNLSDPKSVKEVKPYDLAATFGSGYSLKSITLEITDEPVTEGVVEKVIPWIVGYKGEILSPDLRLGSGSHNASDVLPIEKLDRLNFVWRIQ